MGRRSPGVRVSGQAIPGRQHLADLEAVYEGLGSAEAACRREWPGLRDAIAKARAVADALRDRPAFRAGGCAPGQIGRL